MVNWGVVVLVGLVVFAVIVFAAVLMDTSEHYRD